MSVDTFIFLNNDRFPSQVEWQKALDDAGINIKLEPVDNLRELTGYLPARFNGKDSGFEWYYGPVEKIYGPKSSEMGNRDYAINLVTHSDMQEAICALYSAGILAIITDGLFYDEEQNAFVPGERALEIVRNIDSDEHDYKRKMAEKDTELTDRRCPKCKAPCPIYRKSCKACGYEIGRE